MEGFYGQKESGTGKLKEWVISGTGTFLYGNADYQAGYLTSIEIQGDWLKNPTP